MRSTPQPSNPRDGCAEKPPAIDPTSKTVLFLLNVRDAIGQVPADETPDPRLLRDGLAAAGFVVKYRRLNRFPLNPFAKFGTFYAGFDPIRAICVLLLDRRVDVIVSVGESNVAMIVLLAGILRFKPRIALREVSARGWKKRDSVVNFVVPLVDRVLTLTSHQTAWVAANHRLKAAPDLVGFAIDEAFYKPQECPDGGYILAVGDDFGRDYPCLIAACRNTPYRLVLRTGSVPAIPNEMRARVTVLERLSHRALRDLYAGASVVVVPSLQVVHPSGITALFEAMSVGRAVVASDTGTSRDLIKDGVNGVLVPVGEPLALRAALTRVMQDHNFRISLGVAARDTITVNFSYAAYVRRFAASLRSIVAKG